MANWIINKLTVVGDVATIKKMVETHFKVEPPSDDPDVLSDIVIFDRDTASSDCPNWGFNLVMGPTKDHAHGGSHDDRLTWDGEYSSPFFLEWCSKWGAAPAGVEMATEKFPTLAMDYRFYGRCGERSGHVRIRPSEPVVNDFDAWFWPVIDQEIEESIHYLERAIDENTKLGQPSRDIVDAYVSALGIDGMKAFAAEQKAAHLKALAEHKEALNTYYEAGGKGGNLLAGLRRRMLGIDKIVLPANSDLRIPEAPEVPELYAALETLEWRDGHINRRREVLRSLKSWDQATKHLVRYYHDGSHPEFVEWLANITLDAFVCHIQAEYDREEDYYYLAFNAHDVALFEDRWKDRISPIER